MFSMHVFRPHAPAWLIGRRRWRKLRDTGGVEQRTQNGGISFALGWFRVTTAIASALVLKRISPFHGAPGACLNLTRTSAGVQRHQDLVHAMAVHVYDLHVVAVERKYFAFVHVAEMSR
jgi:hypothetical protein